MSSSGNRAHGWLALVVLVIVVLVAPAAQAASTEPRVAPRPDWVEMVQTPDTELDPRQARGGMAYALHDVQVRLRPKTQEVFVHAVERISSEMGAQSAGQLFFDFTPPHEQLLLHEIVVHRDGRAISHLDLGKLELLQREPGLEAQVYVGTRTAMMILSDVRVGDVIEYAYTVQGTNPVFGGHYMQTVLLQYDVPVGRIAYRVSSDRPLVYALFGGAEPPQISTRGGLTEYTWILDDRAAAQTYDDVPPEHATRPWVQLTDFESWTEIVEWGRSLFAADPRPDPAVVEIAQSIRARDLQPEQQILAALRMVQDDIRYFSLALAESTHRPTPPGMVLERRFGDCKDKSLLAVTLLRELGFDAHVALVRSDGGALLPHLMPSIKAFDHAIVTVHHDGRDWWFDPTMLYQRGRIEDMAARDYHHALPLREGQKGLETLERPWDPRPDISSSARYVVEAWGEPVLLEVTTTFTKDRAAVIRGLREGGDGESFAKAMVGFVHDVYAEARPDGEIEVQDDLQLDEIRTVQRFRLDDPWSRTAGGRVELTVSPIYWRGRLPRAEHDRAAPLALEHPFGYEHHATLELPEEIALTPEHLEVDDVFFAFEYSARVQGRNVELGWQYRTATPRVEPIDFDAYRASVAQLDENGSFSVWYDPVVAGLEGGAFNTTVFTIGLLWCVMLLAAVSAWHRRQPWLRRPDVEWRPDLAGIRGWLIIIAFQVCASPIRLTIDLWQTLEPYSQETWSYLTTPGTEGYHSLWAPLLLFELLGNLAMVVFSLYMLYAFWTKRRSFPLLYVLFTVLWIVFILVDDRLSGVVPGVETDPAETAREWGQAATSLIWVVYMVVSRRVRATFLPPPGSDSRE